MHRYFLEIAYKGTNYSGFQVQLNANTVQAQVEKALGTLFRRSFSLTGSSRTDAGVHALQNFFHFDTDLIISPKSLYNLNAILPHDITANAIYNVPDNAHCRFDAISREYKYYIYSKKNPFLKETAYYFPYRYDLLILEQTAQILKLQTDFTSFSKRNTQVKTFICNVIASQWSYEGDCLIYNVTANRFLRGMVRGMVGTMLKAATGSFTLEQFAGVIQNKDCTRAHFDAPPHGLFLIKVEYKKGILQASI